MHSRLSPLLAFVVAAAFFFQWTNAVVWPTITADSYTVNRDTQRKGKQIILTGVVTVDSFGQNDLAYCGFTNENKTIATVSLGGAGIRFGQQRTKTNAKFYIKEVRTTGKIVWEFDPRGYAISQGKKYTMRLVTKLAKNTQASSYVWRFYCESKIFFPNGTTQKENYPIGKLYKTIQIV